MASTPASRSARARSRTSASSSGTMISPLGAVTRSLTVCRWRRPRQRARLPRQLLLEREVVRLLVARDVQDVAEALGRDQADLGALVFQRDVGRHRGAVQQQVHRLQADAGLAAQRIDPGHHRACGIVGRGRHLVDRDRARRLVDQNQIRERTADIHSDAPHNLPPASPGRDRRGRAGTLALGRRARAGTGNPHLCRHPAAPQLSCMYPASLAPCGREPPSMPGGHEKAACKGHARSLTDDSGVVPACLWGAANPGLGPRCT